MKSVISSPAVPGSQDTRPTLPVPSAGVPASAPAAELQAKRRRHALLWRYSLLVIVLGTVALSVWYALRPISVQVIRPQERAITETVAATGVAGGQKETAVSAPIQGLVAELRVREGDVVVKGQILARVRDEVPQAQLRQAEQALQTARAQLAEAEQGAQPSEQEAARARTRQAKVVVEERAAQIARAEAVLRQYEATIRDSRAQVEQTQTAVGQTMARQELAQKTWERYRILLQEGAIAPHTVDQAETEYTVARKNVEAAQQALISAQERVEAALAARDAAQKDVEAANTLLLAAQEAVAALEADSRTLTSLPRPEGVAVARQRVRDAEAAVRVAREQTHVALVRAPFSGTVTEIVAETGAAVGPGGILRLVQTGKPEIRLNVDENNLADLRVGQHALITASAFKEARVEGRVTRLGAHIDEARGTVEVVVVPIPAPAWLRPGQTLNVNIVLSEKAKHLLVPNSAIRKEGDRHVVFVVQKSRAIERAVTIGESEKGMVPVLEGLSPEDLVIREAENVRQGARVRRIGKE